MPHDEKRRWFQIDLLDLRVIEHPLYRSQQRSDRTSEACHDGIVQLARPDRKAISPERTEPSGQTHSYSEMR